MVVIGWAAAGVALVVILLLMRIASIMAEQRQILSSIQRMLETMPTREAIEERRRLQQDGNGLLASGLEHLAQIERGLSARRAQAPSRPAPVEPTMAGAGMGGPGMMMPHLAMPHLAMPAAMHPTAMPQAAMPQAAMQPAMASAAMPLLQPLPPLNAPVVTASGWVSPMRPAEATPGPSLLDQFEDIRKHRLTPPGEGEENRAP